MWGFLVDVLVFFLGGVYLGLVFVLCCVGMSRQTKRARAHASSSRTNRAPVLDQVRFTSEDQAEEYPKQLERGHLGTRWYCETTAKELYMHEDIEEAFANMGISSLLTMKYDTYGALTAEFLSSLKVTVKDERGVGTISFRLGNEDRELTLNEWCKVSKQLGVGSQSQYAQ